MGHAPALQLKDRCEVRRCTWCAEASSFTVRAGEPEARLSVLPAQGRRADAHTCAELSSPSNTVVVRGGNATSSTRAKSAPQCGIACFGAACSQHRWSTGAGQPSQAAPQGPTPVHNSTCERLCKGQTALNACLWFERIWFLFLCCIDWAPWCTFFMTFWQTSDLGTPEHQVRRPAWIACHA